MLDAGKKIIMLKNLIPNYCLSILFNTNLLLCNFYYYLYKPSKVLCIYSLKEDLSFALSFAINRGSFVSSLIWFGGYHQCPLPVKLLFHESWAGLK